ncbi:type IV pilus modification PilV family protein [Tepidibacter formicigenes]|jgi:prepilin-type N-terminal cleavage/methylation domain-containing protein|uniref:Prepilin-type N-terminal cleavage/methylation domain-containing protein n=1 Tax=Tepidibacter formicigenes DSM 15518 TaxID=1123349 RepID=A0A1M6MH26_9FIRM|nr:prepilin-type N-terminal cleavage/methylation domain-containing protein [Tepidibacter formicigenes]SHJ82782.1 prepilin-type N-terminal cleavage/methylation domain-containing protein [Tepidibacter formicigenes DSM 15518]
MIKSNKGLTLVELIVSLAILGIIVAPLSSYFVNSIKINMNSENRMKANLLAQKYMEEEKHNDVTNEKDETISDGDFQINKKVEKYDSYSIQKGDEFNTDCQIEIGIEDERSREINFYKEVNSISLEIDEDDKIDVYLKKESDESITVEFKHESITVSSYNITLNEDLKDINIKLTCNGSSNVTFEVYALNDVKTNIYIIKSIDSNNLIKVNNNQGKVYVHNNIYDDSAKKDEDTWVYKITITVLKDNNELVKLVGFKNIK